MNPLWASINRFAIGNPKPEPPTFLLSEFSICLNCSNILCLSSLAIPIPLSLTATLTYFALKSSGNVSKKSDFFAYEFLA